MIKLIFNIIVAWCKDSNKRLLVHYIFDACRVQTAKVHFYLPFLWCRDVMFLSVPQIVSGAGKVHEALK